MPRSQLFEVDGLNPPQWISKLSLRYRRSIVAVKKYRVAYRRAALSSSRHAALPSSRRVGWLSHRLSSSFRCTTLSTANVAEWLDRRLK